uniref:Uncharacterized protein n=1 Tax=Arundo donax TaxID=35708 RepID=A0A0A8Y3U0_ARUDO
MPHWKTYFHQLTNEEIMGLKLQHPLTVKTCNIMVDRMTLQRNSRP